MVSRKQSLISRSAATVLALAIVAAPAFAQGWPRTFYPDDPLWKEPAPRPTNNVVKRKIDNLYDFLDNSIATPRYQKALAHEGPKPARNVNTVGEVPDSPWYTNRHFHHRMSVDELKRGPGDSAPPAMGDTWRIISAKTDGVTRGFVIEDECKRRYMLKLDPPDYPEVASGADVIGSKIFYALGYNTPENYIVRFRRENLLISDGVLSRDASGRKRLLTARVVDDMLRLQPKAADGTYRGLASRWIPGEVVGPFRYEGVRADDPNDIVPHEDRRELRGMRVFAAWLNHSDAKSINTLDTLVADDGIPHIEHYLIDFGSILGSAGTGAKRPWYGHEYLLDPKAGAVQLATFGLLPQAWARSHYPAIAGVGLLDYESFDPLSWKTDYPNPAFVLMDRADSFWAAKQVAAFTDAEIRALVETGQYTDPRAAEWIAECLIKRRDKIAKAWVSTVLALDKFKVVDGTLEFDRVATDDAALPEYSVTWSSYCPDSGLAPVPDGAGWKLPQLRSDVRYLIAAIEPDRESTVLDPIRVYIRMGRGRPEIVGVDRQ